MGEVCRKGLEFADDADPHRARVAITYYDSKGEQPLAESKYLEARAGGKADVVIAVGARSSQGVGRLAEQDGVPVFAGTRSAEIAQGRKWIVRTLPTVEREGAAIAREAKMRGMRSVSMFWTGGPFGDEIVRGFRSEFPQSLIATSESVEASRRSFREALIGAQKRGVRDIFTCVNEPWRLAKEAREIGISGTIFGCDGVGRDDAPELKEPALDDSWVVSIGVKRTFRKKFRQRHGRQALVYAAAMHADLIELLRRVADQRLSGEELLKRVFSAGQLSGALSGYTFVRSNHDQYVEPAFVLDRIRGGMLDRS